MSILHLPAGRVQAEQAAAADHNVPAQRARKRKRDTAVEVATQPACAQCACVPVQKRIVPNFCKVWIAVHIDTPSPYLRYGVLCSAWRQGRCVAARQAVFLPPACNNMGCLYCAAFAKLATSLPKEVLVVQTPCTCIGAHCWAAHLRLPQRRAGRRWGVCRHKPGRPEDAEGHRCVSVVPYLEDADVHWCASVVPWGNELGG